MSAESPRRGSRSGGVVVRPQPVSDKSVVESVVNFFQDVTQAYSHSSQKQDDKEKILWVKFEEGDLNDINSNPDFRNTDNTAPLLIILGYTNGIQIWTLPASGEAQEVLSLRQGPVRTLRLLPNPIPFFQRTDLFPNKRPLVALCDASSAGQPYCCVKFTSLKCGEEVHKIPFNHPVTDIKCNERIVVIAFSEKIAAFDACQFRSVFCVVSCYPSPCPDPNPIALGRRWLAYAEKKLVPVHQSGGGMTGDGGQTYAATVINAAKTLTKGLTYLGDTVASSFTGGKTGHPPKKDASPLERNGCQPGIVTIIDIKNVNEGQISVQEDLDGDGLIAHFPAHTSEPIAAMAFDPSGMLLLTADKLGHNFHVYRIMAHPWSCSLGAVHHLYTLHRGDTTAKVQDISFTHDSRWVAISSLRGTTHIFPISAYGGQITVRTHTSKRVVNKASRFHRSAGIEDMGQARASGRHSPVRLSSSPGTSSPGRSEHLRNLHQNTLNNNQGNPRLPPFPHPSTIHPLVQIKQTLALPGMGGTSTSTAKATKAASQVPANGDIMCVATCFARSRGWVAGSPSMSRDKTETKTTDSLFVISWTGNLMEYILSPHVMPGTEKVTDDSPLQMTATARAQWTLIRSLTSPEYKPPLPSYNPLMVGYEAVHSQRPTPNELQSGTISRQESRESLSSDHSSSREDPDDQWLSQVEIITHAGPHRRLWMGPQFSFRTFQGSQTTTILASNPSVLMSQSPEPGVSTMDIASADLDLQSLKLQPASQPIAMPGARQGYRVSTGSGDTYLPSPATGSVLIEADKALPSGFRHADSVQIIAYVDDGSYEQSPSLLEAYSSWQETSAPVQSGEIAEDRLRERLADAMIEAPIKESRAGERHDGSQSSTDNLSTSSESGSGYQRCHSYDARSSPPHHVEHVLVFPSGSGSPDSN